MEVFDARDDFPELKVDKASGSVVFSIHPVSKKGIGDIKAIQKKVSRAGSDIEKQFQFMLEIMNILCPDVKESDVIDIPINKIGPLVSKMVSMAMDYSLPEAEKKIPEPKKRQSSRSRRRASA